MDVYLIPARRDRYELYYEPDDGRDERRGRKPQGFFARMSARFAEMLREAEEWRHGDTIDEPPRRSSAACRRVMGWVVERIAEQRLLWHLRSADARDAAFPPISTAAEADADHARRGSEGRRPPSLRLMLHRSRR